MIFEIVIAVILACVVVLILWIRAPVRHFITCEYCKTRQYLGTDTSATFQRDHLKTYKCKYCRADLFSHTEKGKDETVHIVKGNGWCRYYTNEGWREE